MGRKLVGERNVTVGCKLLGAMRIAVFSTGALKCVTPWAKPHLMVIDSRTLCPLSRLQETVSLPPGAEQVQCKGQI